MREVDQEREQTRKQKNSKTAAAGVFSMRENTSKISPLSKE